MTWRPLLALPARLLAPMLLAALALITAGLIYLEQVEEYTRTVVAQEHLRLTERMALEQTRLEAQSGQGNALQVHRLVTTLGLHQGLTHAWLVGADGRVVASLSRLEQGRPIDALLARQSTPLRQGVAAALRETSRAIHIQHLEAEAALLGHVAIHPDQKLILRVDLAQPLAARLYTGRGEILLEAGILLGFALLLGLLLHGLWFRRAAHLSATAAALGEGNLAARANLQGRDELAQVGTSLDTMAARIEAQHGQLRQLADLIGHSPVVAIVWRNEPDWPVAYVSDNLRRWGHAPEDFKSGALHYADLLHPEDRPRIDAELARHLTRGPDEYAQEYRLRHGDGHWLWIEDRTWLSRDAAGQISAIQGVLLDISERKRLETAQRQILSHLDTVANASPALFWTSGLDKGCDWFNQRWLEFTGRTMAQELGNGWAEGVHPDDFESCLATYVAAFDAREAFSMEYRLRRHDGEYRWLLDRGVPRYDADGQFLGFIGSCLDISEEKRIREALREQEVFFRLMAENIGDFIAVLDLEGRRLYNSPSYRRFFGEGRDLRGSDSFKEIHPDDLEFIRQVFQETVRTGIGQEASYRLITPDGVIHYMESRGSVITDDAGRPLRVVVVSRDVSERRLAEQALRDSEQRFRNLAENSADWIWALDLNGRHTYSNPNIFAILGYSPEEFLTLEPTSLLHPDDLASFGAIFAAARSSRSGWRNVVIRWRRKEGGYRLLESSAAPIIDAQGELQGFQGVDRDITERVQAEQERERLASILEATSDIVSMADPQGNLIYLNSPGRSLMGIAPEGTMPEVIAKVHPPWASDLILGIGVPTAIRDGVWSGETAVLGPAGQEIPVSQVILSHKNEQGQVLYLSTIMRDIRENRAAEQALRELNASLEARVAERTAELQILNQSLESFRLLGVPRPEGAAARCGRLQPLPFGGLRQPAGRRRAAVHRQHPRRGGAHGRADRRPAGLLAHGAPPAGPRTGGSGRPGGPGGRRAREGDGSGPRRAAAGHRPADGPGRPGRAGNGAAKPAGKRHQIHRSRPCATHHPHRPPQRHRRGAVGDRQWDWV
jgi:PAS domain S-box-containing protein